MRLYNLLAALLFTSGFAQVGIGTTTPHASAILDITSTNKGLLLPRVNLTGTNDNTTIASFGDLKGKTTANSIGSTYMELGEDYGATVKGVDDLTKCMDLVKSGGVDATINAATSINDYLQTTKDSSFKIVDQSKESTPYAIPMVKGDDNASLKKAVNKALKELKEDGTLSKISIKYFGEDLTKE